jgi:hypothetical protein
MNVPAIKTAIKLVDTSTKIPQPDEVGLRNGLSRVIVDRDRALGRRERAKTAVTRSHEFVATLQANVDELLAQDRDVTATTAASFKASLAKDLTPKLTQVRDLTSIGVRRIHAENHLAAGREALAALEQDLEDAETQLLACEAKVKLAAKTVVAAHANRLAEELLKKETEAALLRRRLLGVTQMRGPHIGAFPVDAFTMSVARGDAVPRYSHAEPADVAHFDGYLMQLSSNADAQPEGE